MRKNQNDLGQSFQKLIDWTFIRYQGCLIERCKEGFKVLGGRYTFQTLGEAKAKIDEPIKLKND